ncbi:MAG TPA: hypothetical protein VN915_16045 [Elusimicrobiota bacterium]|nr:hypothetical protein [Elusimicrobiota bacterium]
MRISRVVSTAAALGLLLPAAGCFSRVKTSPQADVQGEALDRREIAEATISHWSDVSRLSARRLLEEYGVPDEVHADSLVWDNNGPWRRTVVSNVRPMTADDPVTQQVVSQTVKYNMNRGQSLDILRFDEHLGFDPVTGELSSSADREAHNYLRLNLADDVAHGRLRPDQARDSYASIVKFEQAGKTSPYLLGLRFSVGP